MIPIEYRLYALCGLVTVLVLLLSRPRVQIREDLEELARTSPFSVTVELVAVLLVVVGAAVWPWIAAEHLLRRRLW